MESTIMGYSDMAQGLPYLLHRPVVVLELYRFVSVPGWLVGEQLQDVRPLEYVFNLVHMSCSLNSLKGGYTGDYIGGYYRGH